MNHIRRIIVVVAAACIAASSAAAPVAEPISYNRDVRPILSAHCFACHGPDAAHRKKEMRLDLAEAATAKRGDRPAAIVPGDVDASELVRRIYHADVDERMPPAETHKPLSEAQKRTLRDWVAAGAPYEPHWAFITPRQSDPPAVKRTDWTRNSIDRFVLARLEAEGLSPSPEADRVTLIRRVYLDLIGLPPTPEEVDAFVADTTGDAYERVVDRLLASPHFGERLALVWLDAARYADTNGFSIDEHRDVWPWRDWVIEAFNRNMPFDRFVVEQIAGDLLPDATDRQKLATGFLRQSMSTHEGGTIPAEYRVTYIADKIDTVSSAMLGLTLRCAQCHDHKYDPLTQEDYYRMFAFFGRSVENGHGATNANTPPLLDVEPVFGDAATMRAALKRRVDDLRRMRRAPTAALGAERAAWEAGRLAEARALGGGSGEAAVEFAFPPSAGEGAAVPAWVWANPTRDGQRVWLRRVVTLDAKPKLARLFVCADDAAAVFVNGAAAGTIDQRDSWLKPVVLDVTASLKAGQNVIAAEALNGNGPGAVLAVLAIETDGGVRYVVSDGQWQVTEKPGEAWKVDARADAAGWTAATVIATHGQEPWGDVYGKLVRPPAALAAALATPAGERNEEQWDSIVGEFIKASRPALLHVDSIDNEIRFLRRQIETGKITVMVMADEATPQTTYLLVRGQYDQPDKSKPMTPGTPASLPPMPADAPANRLGLARWLVDPANPLTARVAVNRWWQMLFGAGLAATANDLGLQGEYPSHAELLDWLAREYADGGWDTKAMIRLIVTSATYRQASHVTEAMRRRDPLNRLLARGARHRLAAELVRDNAMAIGGLLDRSVGGPPVFPPQPDGLWQEISHFGHMPAFTSQSFYASSGVDARRRGLYTYWKRTGPPPGLAAFDAPTREVCTISRATTNTPLQALVLLNDPQYVDAARALAVRAMRDGGAPGSVDSRITRMFRLAAGRSPDAEELTVLRDRFKRAAARYKADGAAARAFVGDAAADAAERAAYTDVAAVIMNLDEVITKE